jgi:hypothetical protein
MPDWEWKLRLFASADLVGSTAYKQSKADTPQHWAPTFKEFFRSFPAAVETAYGQLPIKCPACQDKLVPWKFSGDEILFHTTLEDSTHSVSHIAAFKHAVAKFPEEWAQKQLPLKLKATAWVAGFPINNTELEMQASGVTTLDFIGPGIDLGFRIARFSDTRRFILSADLALLILDSIDRTECSGNHFQIHFQGKESLKGVIGNAPYPILWLDMHDGTDDQEDLLLGVKRTPQPDVLKPYLRNFLDNTPTLMRPFIDGDSDSKYSQIPPGHDAMRREMEAEESGRGYYAGTNGEPEGGQDIILKRPRIVAKMAAKPIAPHRRATPASVAKGMRPKMTSKKRPKRRPDTQ